MRGILKKIFTLFLAIVTIITITSCGKKNKDIFSYNPNLSTIRRDEDLDDFDWDGLTEMEVKEPDKYSCTYMDVEPNFALNVYAKSAHLGAEQLEQSITVVDSEQNEVKPMFKAVQFNDDEAHPLTFTISPGDAGYKKGMTSNIYIYIRKK